MLIILYKSDIWFTIYGLWQIIKLKDNRRENE